MAIGSFDFTMADKDYHHVSVKLHTKTLMLHRFIWGENRPIHHHFYFLFFSFVAYWSYKYFVCGNKRFLSSGKFGRVGASPSSVLLMLTDCRSWVGNICPALSLLFSENVSFGSMLTKLLAITDFSRGKTCSIFSKILNGVETLLWWPVLLNAELFVIFELRAGGWDFFWTCHVIQHYFLVLALCCFCNSKAVSVLYFVKIKKKKLRLCWSDNKRTEYLSHHFWGGKCESAWAWYVLTAESSVPAKEWDLRFRMTSRCSFLQIPQIWRGKWWLWMQFLVADICVAWVSQEHFTWH